MVQATRLARGLNHPLRAIATGIHGGKLGRTGSLVAVEGTGLVVSGIKKAEDEDALIVRVYETAGRDVDGVIKLNPALGKVSDACEVDLVERKLASSSAKVDGNSIRVRIPARGLCSVKVALRA